MTSTDVAEGGLRVARLRPDAVLPTRAHADDAGLDLVAVEAAHIPRAGGRAVVGTGIAIEVPGGWTGLVCPRSGLAARHGIGVVNAPGVVDAGYRGEVRVVLLNTDPDADFDVAPGDRIAQLVLVPARGGDVVEVAELSAAARNERGFGSSGGVRAFEPVSGAGD